MNKDAPKDHRSLENITGHFTPISITDTEFKNFSNLIYTRTGIHLPVHKTSLLTARLHKTIRTKGLSTFADYYSYIQNDRTGTALQELIDRVSTNFSYFFREKKHFEYLQQVALPEICARLRKEGNLDLRVWSAGCATGEEAYTLGMIIMDLLGFEYDKWQAGVLATDISTKALHLAKTGLYEVEQLQYLPAAFIKRFFSKAINNHQGVTTALKNEITFRKFNLLNDKFPFKKSFHVIFCRNVMIYFDNATRNALFKRLFDVLEPGGYLFVGQSEAYCSSHAPFQKVMPGLYHKANR